MGYPLATPQSTPHPAPAQRTGDAEVRAIFVELSRLPSEHPRRRMLRAEIVVRYQGLARSLARRYRGRGEPLDDLVQTANVGLVKAVDGFDVERENAFPVYAVPTIVGELKRHFRDRGWAVHAPRRTQELKLLVHRAINDLTQLHGGTPTVAALAEHLELDDRTVTEGLLSQSAYSSLSIDAFRETHKDHLVLEAIVENDRRLDQVVDRISLWPLLGELPDRERAILLRRFYGNQTQSEIALSLGISQVHVSRLQSKACSWLRERLRDGDVQL